MKFLNMSIAVRQRLANRRANKEYKNYLFGNFGPRSKCDLSERHVRWVERPSDAFRCKGYADQIVMRIGHQGWYCGPCQEEVFRGIVYQLPTRRGANRFAYGYADPCNEGAAFLSFDPCDDLRDAALWADSMAERFAKSEREWQAREQARFEIEAEMEAALQHLADCHPPLWVE